MTVDGRNGYRVAEAEVVEFIEISGKLADGVALVDAEHNGLAALAEHCRHLTVRCYDAAADIGDKDYNLGAVNGELRLTPHLL